MPLRPDDVMHWLRFEEEMSSPQAGTRLNREPFRILLRRLTLAENTFELINGNMMAILLFPVVFVEPLSPVPRHICEAADVGSPLSLPIG